MSPVAKKVTDKYVTYQYVLSCGCQPYYRVAPPALGAIITCQYHGETTVISREKV